MAGLWDQLGGFFEGVGDVASKIGSAGDQIASTFSSFKALQSGTSVGVPPSLAGLPNYFLPPGYAPLYPSPSGNAVNTSSLGVDAINARIAEKRNRELLMVGGVLVGVWLLDKAT